MNDLEAIIEENAGLIWQIAKKFYGIPKNDLYQAGVLGVIKAYRNYQVDGTTKFSTYAYKYIYGEMYLQAANKEIKLSKDVIKLVKLIEQGKMRLTQELMREPSLSELAAYLEIDEAVIEEARMYVKAYVSMDDDTEYARSLHEVIPCESEVSTEDKIMIDEGIKCLDSLEQDIINARYFEDLTQSETARKLGITQVMVSRYEQRSLSKMRDYMYM